MKTRILIFILLFTSVGKFIYAYPSILERENFVNYIVDVEASQKWWDFLILQKIKILQKIHRNKGANVEFVDDFKKNRTTPVIKSLFVSGLRHQAHISKNPIIQLTLGIIYTGNFLEHKNYNLGLNYLVLSAENNNIDAQSQLCFEYSNGIYISRDMKERVKWCYIASENGNKKIKENLKELKSNMSKEFEYLYKEGIDQGRQWLKNKK